MTLDQVITLGHYMLQTALLVGAPVLLAAFIVGITVSILQAATQIHEMTLTFIPKIFAALLAVFIFGGWMLSKLVSYTHENFEMLLRILQ